MARSVLDLAKIADTLQKKGVSLRVMDQAIDTTTSEGRLMFSSLGLSRPLRQTYALKDKRMGLSSPKPRESASVAATL